MISIQMQGKCSVWPWIYPSWCYKLQTDILVLPLCANWKQLHRASISTFSDSLKVSSSTTLLTHVGDPDGYSLIEKIQYHDDDKVEARGRDRSRQLGGQQPPDGL